MIPLGREHPIPFTKGSKNPLAGRLISWRAQGGFRISPLRALQTTRNPPETATVGARRPRRGATPDHPVKAANIIPPDRAYRSSLYQTGLLRGSQSRRGP